MTDITKKVDRIIPGVERAVTFTEADGGEGDVFLVRDSLGLCSIWLESTALRINDYAT